MCTAAAGWRGCYLFLQLWQSVDYHRYAQPATENPIVYSANRPAKERSLYAFWQEMRSAIIKMFRQEEYITENI